MNLEWKGVMPAVTTKFTSDDQLDLELFNKNIRAQLDVVYCPMNVQQVARRRNLLLSDAARIIPPGQG